MFVGLLALGACLAANAAVPIRVDIPYSMLVTELGSGLYRIEVDNTNPTSFIKTFSWTPPGGMTVTAVTSSEGGRCALSAGTIECTAGKKGITPPPCMCVGGAMTVNFTATGRDPTFANGYWTHYGVVGSMQITSTIPVNIASFADVPLCAKGQVSTKAVPCAKQ